MNGWKRAAAFVGVVLICALVIGTLVCAVTGSRYFYGMLFLMIVVPVVLWVIFRFIRR